MRPGQNKRMRGRNNNNRKGPNPLTRTYESNGPDVKIRGTAHHVAEKYLQLARDAQSSGDPVMAESYLQHAEHYFRLIAAAQLAQQQAQMGASRPPGEAPDTADESEDDDDFGVMPDRFASPLERQQPQQQQPYPQHAQQPQGQYPNQQPYGGPQGDQRQPGQQMDRQDRQDRQQGDRQYQDRGPRQDRQDRPFYDRNQNRNRNQNRDNYRGNGQQRDYQPRGDYQQEQPRFEAQPEQNGNRAPAVEPDIPVGLPSFITAPSRPAPQDAAPVAEAPPRAAAPEAGTEHEDATFHLRNRRRRRPKAASEGDTPVADDVPAGE